MKVLLINPPRIHEIMANNPAIVEEERGYSPPLGLLYIAAFLEKYSKHEVAVIDSQVEKLDYYVLEKRVALFQPDVAGITTLTLTIIDVIKTIDVVKRVNKNAMIVLGGPHGHLFPNETIKIKNVDYVVLGEGEVVFNELLSAIYDKAALRKVRGLVFKDRGKIVNTGFRPNIKGLDELPFPSRHLVPYKKYSSLLASGKVVTTIMSSRGCPYKCSFCDRPHLGKIFRARSAENVADELAECTKMGIHDFLFYDDTFTVDKGRVIDICNEIVNRKLDVNWHIRSRVDNVDEEIMENLKRAGCKGIHYGIEAGTDKVLNLLNKSITIAQAKRVFDLTRKCGIPILAYFMIGNPKETLEDILQTFKVMNDLKPDYAHITIFTPFPGTIIYFEGLRNGDFKRDYWKEFAEDPRPDFVPPHWDEIFTRSELNHLLIKAYKGFYLRPSHILSELRHLRTFEEFKRKSKAGLKVLMWAITSRVRR